MDLSTKFSPSYNIYQSSQEGLTYWEELIVFYAFPSTFISKMNTFNSVNDLNASTNLF
jgi:hypothetical protein